MKGNLLFTIIPGNNDKKGTDNISAPAKVLGFDFWSFLAKTI